MPFQLHFDANVPDNWKELWLKRQCIEKCSTRLEAADYVEDNQQYYNRPLCIDLHPVDGYVVFTEND